MGELDDNRLNVVLGGEAEEEPLAGSALAQAALAQEAHG
jgi:hypothetical protein